MDLQEWLEAKLGQWLAAYEGGEDLTIDILCRGEETVNAEMREQLQGAIGRLKDNEGFLSADDKDSASQQPDQTDTDWPERIGRYRIDGFLGRGGFGRVYRGFDEALNRPVAIKVPRAERISRQEDVDEYLREARALASLDHPNIVGVHDVGQSEEFPCYIVSKLIDGGSLSDRIKDEMLPHAEAAALVASMADALHYLHTQDLVHRDVKPGNILIDRQGKPYLADFGLVLNDQDSGQGPDQIAGSLGYMSPEQASGKSKYVTGCSDIYSLGAVLYQLLTGRLPLSSSNPHTCLDLIVNKQPKPPRQIDDGIPQDLERICLKALSKEQADRYSTAKDMADELRQTADGSKTAGEPTSRLMALVFTDLVDSSGLKVKLGDADYVEQIAQPHNEIFRQLMADCKGAVENKNTGDGFLATFPSVNGAVNFALLFHHALRSREWESLEPKTRIGIHLGDTVEFASVKGDDELASHAADMCGRVMSLGAGGQTLLTRAAFESARQYVRGHPDTGEQPLPEIDWKAHGQYLFQGADEPMEVFEVGAVGFAPLEAPTGSGKAHRSVDETGSWRPWFDQEIPGKPGWILQEKLGVGGFGEVWLAHHAKLQRVFKFCFDAVRLRSFKKELTLFRLIQQRLGTRPDMARLLDVRVDRLPYFLESEYVASGNLQQWYKSRKESEPVPLETRLKLLADVARAVAAAHSLGIIHKDIKPSNIFIEELHDGRLQPKLADFGIGVLTDRALLDGVDVTGVGLTEGGVLGSDSSHTGTRMYMPPEADAGAPASIAGDVYALGVLLYQLVTNNLSGHFGGGGWEIHVEDELLREDIAACTHRDPERRLSSAAELAERLETLSERREHRNERQKAQKRIADQKRRMRTLRFGMAVTMLFAVGAAIAVVWVDNARNEAEIARKNAEDAQAAEKLEREKAEEAREAEETARVQAEILAGDLKLANDSLLEALKDSADRAVEVLVDSHHDPQEWAVNHNDVPTDLLLVALRGRFGEEDKPGFKRRLALGLAAMNIFEFEEVAAGVNQKLSAEELETLAGEVLSELALTANNAGAAECMYILHALERSPVQALAALKNRAGLLREEARNTTLNQSEPDSDEPATVSASTTTAPDENATEPDQAATESDEITPFETAGGSNAKLAANRVHQARLAILALLLKDPSLAESLCQAGDSTLVTVLIHEFRNWYAPLQQSANAMADLEDPALQYMICCAVGSHDNLEHKEVEKTEADESQSGPVGVSWPQLLSRWYHDSPDASVHSAAALVARQQELQFPEQVPLPEDSHWQEFPANERYLTMIRIPAMEGSDQSHSFHVSDREVSVSLFTRFYDESSEAGEEWTRAFDEKALELIESGTKRLNTPDHPVRHVSLIEAILFCNWMSRQCGREPCYRRESPGWRIDRNENGFRLPTVSEWAHAAQAGTSSFQYWGDPTEDLHHAYAQLDETHPRVCGSLLPNQWGLFDVCGNVAELCVPDERILIEDETNIEGFVICGGSFTSPEVPTGGIESYKTRHESVGFRIVLSAGASP